jgi:hypothetical protein
MKTKEQIKRQIKHYKSWQKNYDKLGLVAESLQIQKQIEDLEWVLQ